MVYHNSYIITQKVLSTLPKPMVAMLDEIAVGQMRSRTAVVRDALERYINDHRKGNIETLTLKEPDPQ